MVLANIRCKAYRKFMLLKHTTEGGKIHSNFMFQLTYTDFTQPRQSLVVPLASSAFCACRWSKARQIHPAQSYRQGGVGYGRTNKSEGRGLGACPNKQEKLVQLSATLDYCRYSHVPNEQVTHPALKYQREKHN